MRRPVDLFDAEGAESLARRAPLAERLRPKSLCEVVGQDHLAGPGGPLRAAVGKGRVGAIVL
ncbi:MAG TPA: replication-associated recombination protein A, partial [Rubrobacteraceae bacterium]|nr:replication-associated recombination protein A [Rubrobacteraceae bacterium]